MFNAEVRLVFHPSFLWMTLTDMTPGLGDPSSAAGMDMIPTRGGITIAC